MIDNDILLGVLDANARRRAARRDFLRSAGSAAVALGGLSMLAACGGDSSGSGTVTPTPTSTITPTPSPSATSVLQDQDTLNFALNLEYLEAQFYSFAVTGAGLPASLLTGSGVQGAVTGGRQVSFTDTVVREYAREIAADEVAHVAFLRSALGGAVVSQPAINIDGGAGGPFAAAATAAGLAPFDPYGSDENFLLGAYIFEDVGVTAYKGASVRLNAALLLDAAAGILATEAYHAGLIRTVLYGKGLATPSLRTNADAISNARDGLDGSTDLDQGITGTATVSNLVPTDSRGLTFSRTAGQVLNIVYLNPAAVAAGGFFPAGVNGNIKMSAAS